MTFPTKEPLTTDPEPAVQAGNSTWEAYLKVAEGEGDRLGDHSATTMSGMLTFAGLFAAVVTAFLIETYKALSPDTGVQNVALVSESVSPENTTSTSDATTQQFHAPAWAITVNALWFYGLAISLICGLLITLVQDWTKDFLRAKHRPVGETIKQHSLEHMQVYMGVQRYGLESVAWVVVGLMHSAVITFLVGLALFLFTVHPAPAWVVTVVAGLAGLLYIAASCIPFFDPSCPYRTPLTYLLEAIVILPVSLVSCIITLVVIIGSVIASFFSDFLKFIINWYSSTTPPPTPHPGPGLNGFLWAYLWRPSFNWRFLCASLSFIARQTRSQTRRDRVTFPDYVMRALAANREALPHELPLSTEQMTFLWDCLGLYSLEHPDVLHYFVSLIDVRRQHLDPFFVGLRNNENCVAKIAEALPSVDSIFAGVNSIRLLQLLLQADTPQEQYAVLSSNEDSRWRNMHHVLAVFPKFVAKLDMLQGQSLSRMDTRLLEAVSDLRWVLILLIGRIQEDAGRDSKARTQPQQLFIMLDHAPNLRLLTLSSCDHEDLEELFMLAPNPRLELVSRTAYTLLEGVRRCGQFWSWEGLNSLYLKQNLLQWRGLCADEMEHRDKPCASDSFLETLRGAGLDEWRECGSDFAAPSAESLGTIIIDALRDLASLVDVEMSPKQASEGRPDTLHSPVWLNGHTPRIAPRDATPSVLPYGQVGSEQTSATNEFDEDAGDDSDLAAKLV